MIEKRKSLLRVLCLMLLSGLAVLPLQARGETKETTRSTFATPDAAVAALVAAVREADHDKLLAIFGPGSEDLVSSGDPVSDQHGRQRFLKAYAEKNSLVKRDERHLVLHVGSDDYPFPIPLVKGERGWFFDTRAGKEEILDRRIGRNELRTMEVLQAYTAAQREYACRIGKSDSSPAHFATKLISSEGKHDGLYWPAANGETESPFGPLIARAGKDGYGEGFGAGTAEPFHGYFYKILTAQGPHANGGAFDYLVNGEMVLGFAMVAYPANYGSTGIKTFIVNQEGVIHEKDLGEKTAEAAKMTTYDPDETWKVSEEPED